ncbi:hypothetical protein M3J09_000459 [Ascochyta lentis]
MPDTQSMLFSKQYQCQPLRLAKNRVIFGRESNILTNCTPIQLVALQVSLIKPSATISPKDQAQHSASTRSSLDVASFMELSLEDYPTPCQVVYRVESFSFIFKAPRNEHV